MGIHDINRRSFLARTALAGAATALSPQLLAFGQQQPTPPASPASSSPPAPPNVLKTMRDAGATTPIQSIKLRDTIFMLQGVGGNMLAQIGPDGTLLINASVNTATNQLKTALGKLGQQPLRILINTDWQFNHTDGNAAMHDAGAFIMAQENTRLWLAKPPLFKFYNLQLTPAPTSGLPQETFTDEQKVYFDNDELDLFHAQAAHSDSDVFIHFVNGNVIHTGDMWFNGSYPLIDNSTGGTINGLIQGVDRCLELSDDHTKIVPGRGAAGGKAALGTYRDMLATVANRVEKLKLSERTLAQTVAARPTADLDPTWGKGEITPDDFVTMVYQTL